MKTPLPPYLGAAYYPEAWPTSLQDEDIRLMKQAGLNVMRMAEFAWSTMEPREGEYHFEWLHEIVEKLASAGIASILCTPTATPPLWLTEQNPDILYLWENGKRIGHGGRRHYCPTAPVYRAYIEKIVTRLAQEFGKDYRVIGWQIDNELDYYGKPCVCQHCTKRFHAWLEQKYGSIANLNKAWCTTLWSQTYDRFDQVPAPRGDVWHNPALRTAWSDFASDTYVEFTKFQADILRAHGATQSVGTDMMNTGHLDFHDMLQNLDITQVNHYHMMDNLWETAFWFDAARTYKSRPFWNTETGTCWNGSVTANGYKEPGFCRANSWLPFALGGEATLYWLWRQHYAGHELMHGAVVSSAGRPLYIFDEIREVADGLTAAGDFLNHTIVDKSRIALTFSNRTQQLFEHQPMVQDVNYPGNTLTARVYRPLAREQWRMEVLEPAQDISCVKLLISPFLPMLDECSLRERLKQWIEHGGIWIAGPLTDVRDLSAAKYTHSHYGTLEEWAGFRSCFEIPGHPRNFAFSFTGDEATHQGSVWYDAMEAIDAKVLARYTEGPVKGMAAIVEKPLGEGTIVVMGTMPEPATLQHLVRRYAKKCGIAPAAKASPNLLCVPRSGEGGRGMVVVEHENKPATLTLPASGIDLISGKRLKKGPLKVKPYQVLVVKY
jgi:beta-galactosidase GanA